MKRFCIPVIALVLAACNSAGSIAGDDSGFRQEVVSDAVKQPWAMAWLPQGDMLITSRQGELFRLAANGQPQAIAGVPDVHVNGQGGLLDVAVHKDWVYLSYSRPEASGGSNTAVMRARLENNTLVEQSVLYTAEPATGSGRHYGSRIAFDPRGYLYFSVGDRGARDINPQDPARDGGKIYRLTADGKVPPDNPFVDQDDALAAMYSLGHRNPQGMTVHPETGAVWIHEHGPRGGDEINLIKAGANYGWPILSYGINYSGTSFAEAEERSGYESPLHYWDPSIAPSGMTFISSERYPAWRGDLLVGSLKFRHLELCDVDGSKVNACKILFKGIGRVRDVKQGPDGFVYVLTADNGVVRLLPKG